MMMDAPSRSGIGGIDEDFVLCPRTFLLALRASRSSPIGQTGYHSDEERKEAQPFPGLLFGFFGSIAEHQLLQGVLCREALAYHLVTDEQTLAVLPLTQHRDNLIADDIIAHRVGQEAFQTVTGSDTDIVLLHREEDEHAGVSLSVTYSPVIEQIH